MSDGASVKLGGRTREIVESLAETIIPSEGPSRPGASDVDLADRLMEWLGSIPGASRPFLASCWAWEYSPLWTGRLSRFSRLSAEERESVLLSFEESRLSARRWALIFLKAVFMAAFYNHPRIWGHIGYEPGCFSEPPREGEVADWLKSK